MTKQLLFSILIANYNNGRYLMDAVESIRQQTYANWEIVLVDDGSTDNSEELYAELEKDERIHIYRNEQNMGCGYTKRRCAELAKGEICGFLDPDDVLTPEALSAMAETHSEHPEASLIHSDHYECDNKLNITNIYKGSQIPDGECFLKFQRGVSHFATFKRAIYNATIGINPQMKRAVDMDLYYLLDEVGKFVYLNKALYYYRQGTGLNISLGANTYSALAWDIIAQYKSAERRHWDLEKDFIPIVTGCMKSIIESVSGEQALQAEDKVRNTKTYKTGLLFTNFFKMFKRSKK